MLLSAAILGFLGSLHCLGMCGPIAFMLPIDRKNSFRRFAQLSLYHFGRIISYAIMGFAFGLIGRGLYLFGMQQKLSIVIGVVMVLLVLLPSNKFNTYKIAQPVYFLLAKVKSKLGSLLKKRTADAFLTIGLLNGFLPCGLVYMALLGAIAFGSAINGALYMALFGIGTIPLMTTAIFAGGWFKKPMKAKIRRLVPLFVALIGALFILRGLGLGIPYVSPQVPNQYATTAEIDCHTP